MDISLFHFARPLALWILVVIPIMWIVYALFHQRGQLSHRLESFIDKHLLSHLLVSHSNKRDSLWKALLLLSFVWTALTVALAGPRWDFDEIETYSQDQSLVILLDLSQSMDVTDLSPSRIARARQKINDLIDDAQGLRLGIIAFAADPHMISPLTDDMETIRHLLPSLTTDLVYVQGSRLSPALAMAENTLKTVPGENKAIVLISDGGFEDTGAAISKAKQMGESGITIHTLGVGTETGAPIQDKKGHLIKKDGESVLSRLEKDKMQEISKGGNGHYLEPHFADQAEKVILDDLKNRSEAQVNIAKTTRFWTDHYTLLVLAILPVLLSWFRKGYLIPLLLLMPLNLDAIDFKNADQQAKTYFDQGNYEKAATLFTDPYNKGVALYKQGNFAEAEQQFKESDAQYNLGNALAMQMKLEEAIAAYENVLEMQPDHQEAKDNLEIVKKMLEEQDQNDQQEDEEQNQEDEDQNQQEEEEKPSPPQEPQSNESKPQPQKSEEDYKADQWLNRIEGDPKDFLKNKFYLESQLNGTKETVDPW